jgi:hypothetical protein
MGIVTMSKNEKEIKDGKWKKMTKKDLHVTMKVLNFVENHGCVSIVQIHQELGTGDSAISGLINSGVLTSIGIPYRVAVALNCLRENGLIFEVPCSSQHYINIGFLPDIPVAKPKTDYLNDTHWLPVMYYSTKGLMEYFENEGNWTEHAETLLTFMGFQIKSYFNKMPKEGQMQFLKEFAECERCPRQHHEMMMWTVNKVKDELGISGEVVTQYFNTMMQVLGDEYRKLPKSMSDKEKSVVAFNLMRKKALESYSQGE